MSTPIADPDDFIVFSVGIPDFVQSVSKNTNEHREGLNHSQ